MKTQKLLVVVILLHCKGSNQNRVHERACTELYGSLLGVYSVLSAACWEEGEP